MGLKKYLGGWVSGKKSNLILFQSWVWHSSSQPSIIILIERVATWRLRTAMTKLVPILNCQLLPYSDWLQCLNSCQYTNFIPDYVVCSVWTFTVRHIPWTELYVRSTSVLCKNILYYKLSEDKKLLRPENGYKNMFFASLCSFG